jgi:UDP-N-acetylmuramate dehydrogenase
MNNLLKKSVNFNIIDSYNGIFLQNESLKDKTTFKIGGNASFFASPSDIKSLIYLLQEAKNLNVPIFILGGGSNLVVSDDGIDKLVISTESFDFCEHTSSILTCGAGCTFEKITEFCIKNEISGLENFAGLPGTTGGAVFMNARCYEVSVSDVLHSVKYIDLTDFSVKTYEFNPDDWDYKKSPFQTGDKIIVEVNFKVKKGNSKEIEEKSLSFIKDRENKGHFKFPSAGSVFKNNRNFGKPSGKIIDEVGLRGISVGNAQVAPWHGNFIINNGNATASDVLNLVELIQEKVKEKTGFLLECEIIFTDNI